MFTSHLSFWKNRWWISGNYSLILGKIYQSSHLSLDFSLWEVLKLFILFLYLLLSIQIFIILESVLVVYSSEFVRVWGFLICWHTGVIVFSLMSVGLVAMCLVFFPNFSVWSLLPTSPLYKSTVSSILLVFSKN